MTRKEAIKICSREKEQMLAALDACADGDGYVSPDGMITALDYVEALSVAIAALREQEERSNNKPLTPDELRKMGGKPYFHVSLQNGQRWWAILDPYYARRVEDYHYGEYWLAYRNELPEPPEEEV